MKRIALAYSGDLASSVALAWLRQHAGAEVVTVTLDIGQGPDLAVVRERALALGAVRAHVLDAREEFGRDFVLPAMQAGAFAADARLSLAIARALIAKRLVEIARMESAAAVAHGSAGASTSGLLLDVPIRTIDPALEIIVPAKVAGFSEDGLASFARDAEVHVPRHEGVWVDANLWTRMIAVPGGGTPDDEAYLLTRSPDEAPESPAYLDLEFAHGVPVRTNGVEMAFTELVESVETIAGAHGVGRARSADGTCMIEAPAATVLTIAHQALEVATLGPDLAEMKRRMAAVHARHVAKGRWFADPKTAIDAFVRIAQQRVAGTVRLRLLKGQCTVVDRQSPNDVVRGSASTPKAVA
jgi:argininosuccinate synthase